MLLKIIIIIIKGYLAAGWGNKLKVEAWKQELES